MFSFESRRGVATPSSYKNPIGRAKFEVLRFPPLFPLRVSNSKLGKTKIKKHGKRETVWKPRGKENIDF